MAVGEAACASVHGANRLGSNSLTDLVVFGRAAAIRAGEVVDKSAAVPAVNRAREDEHPRPLRPPAACQRQRRRRRELRDSMQRTMQEDAAVFRTAETLQSGVRRMTEL